MMKVFLISLLITACSTLNILHTDPTYECSNRFEFRHILKNYMKELNSCSFVREKYPICGKNITISVSIDPPYTMSDKNGSVTGLLPGMIAIAMDTCCHGCAEVHYKIVPGEIEKYFADNADIIMPHEGSMKSSHFIGYDYVPFIEIKGVTFLTKRSSKEKLLISKHLFQSIMGTWPLFVAAFLMAFIAGCVVWILDSWFNGDEFPTSFPRGPFEGFWWAFVSMTTVGYGDRAPKSVSARIFAVIWILAGITIFSMYTATLTSALTSKMELSKVEKIFGRKVGVLSTTAAGHAGAIMEHAVIKFYDDVYKLMDALHASEVYAIALDDNLASFHLSHLTNKVDDLVKHHRLSMSGNSYGILTYDKNFTTFIKSFLQSNEDNRNAMLAYVKNDQKIFTNHPEKDSDGTTALFSWNSTLFYISLGILIGLGVFTVILGLTCKWCFKKNKSWLDMYVSCQQYKKKTKIYDNEVRLTDHSNEEFMVELKELTAKWSKIFQEEENINM